MTHVSSIACLLYRALVFLSVISWCIVAALIRVLSLSSVRQSLIVGAYEVPVPVSSEQLVPQAPAAHVSALVCLELSPVVSREYQNNHNSILRRVVTSDICLEDLCFV